MLAMMGSVWVTVMVLQMCPGYVLSEGELNREEETRHCTIHVNFSELPSFGGAVHHDDLVCEPEGHELLNLMEMTDEHVDMSCFEFVEVRQVHGQCEGRVDHKKGGTVPEWMPERGCAHNKGDACQVVDGVPPAAQGKGNDHDDTWLMQRGKGKDNKRRRSPTPRRRRIPARRARTEVEPSQRQYRRAAWARTPQRPTCSQSWVNVPWRRDRGRSSRELGTEREHKDDTQEDNGEEEAINLTAAPSSEAAVPPLPPFDEGIRTWGELIGILDPMDQPEAIIDPLVVENAVDRIRRMGADERSQLAIQLVRFLAILYAEILRMLRLVEQDDGTSLLQVPGPEKKGSPYADSPAPRVQVPPGTNMEDEEVTFMQTAIDKFGAMLQKLLGLMEKLGQPTASVRARFLRSMLAEVQRPGTHITAVVIDKMDRLQALLLSFDDGVEMDVTDVDRDWCFNQWAELRATLMDVRQEAGTPGHGAQEAASSTDIVCLEDSQNQDGEGGCQMAVLPDGSTRPLTQEEMEEIAFHEEMEVEAAARETQADEQRWLEYRAQCLREAEEKEMQEAMNNSGAEPSSKKARVMVQVEGEGGRVVRSEVFNLVVNEGEALTYKIMVLPRDDPETRALRRRQAVREGQASAETSSSESAASAETLRTDAKGKVLQPPRVLSNAELEEFMQTEEGEQYYQKWLRGHMTCAMVRERSGCGLLAKFFSRKVEEDETEKMLAAVVQAEADQQAESGEKEHEGTVAKQDESGKKEPEGKVTKPDRGEEEGQTTSMVGSAGSNVTRALAAPTTWPSLALRTGGEAINLDSQGSDGTCGAQHEGLPGAVTTTDYSTIAADNLEGPASTAGASSSADGTGTSSNNEGEEGGTAALASSTPERAVTGQTNLKQWLL